MEKKHEHNKDEEDDITNAQSWKRRKMKV